MNMNRKPFHSGTASSSISLISFNSWDEWPLLFLSASSLTLGTLGYID